MNDINLLETETGESEFTLDRKPEESLSELTVRLENCEKRYSDLKNQNEELHNKNLDLASEINQGGEEVRTLQEELYTANARITQIQSREESLTQKLQECREIAERQRTHTMELKDEIRLYKEENQELNREIGRLKEGIEIYEKDNRNLENEIEILIRKHTFEREEFNREIAALNRRLSEKETNLTECIEIVNTWEQKKAQLEKENQRLREQVDRYIILIDDLMQRIQEMRNSSDAQDSNLSTPTPETEESQKTKEDLFEQPENISESIANSSEREEYPWAG